MFRRRWIPILTWLCLAPANATGTEDKPQQVLDLHYGEVLFHFYQEDYFTAITHLMAAQQQDLLQHHRDESELLLGGLQLSYGMLDAAESQFQRLLDPGSDTALHNRVRYYLTKINYQRGNFHKAHETLQRIGEPRDKSLHAELALLDANLNMHMGRNATAAERLKAVRAPEGWEDYLSINRGIALLRAGDIESGRRILDKHGRQSGGTEESRALRDRANLGLGYELLRVGQPELAREYLNRVRQQGPFMQAALLGAGWADAERGDFQGALTPWLKLTAIEVSQSAAHEARLAVPYALAQMGDDKRAIHYYEQALEYYLREQQQIERAIEAAENGTLLSLLSQTDTGTSGGWLNTPPTLDDAPSGRYLIDVLSGNRFQESLKDYRDLGYLLRRMARWREDIDLYYDMVDTRRVAYRQRAPQIRARLEQQEAAALLARWRDYRSQLNQAQAENAPLQLANHREQEQWQRLEAMEEKLAGLPDEPRYDKLREKAAWLRGVLYWKIHSEFRKRLWNTRKQIDALEPTLRDTLEKHQGTENALSNVKSSFTGYDQRIEALQARIQALLPRLEATRGRVSGNLQHLVLEALEARKQRLASYRSQARYALARSYDKLARSDGGSP